MADLLDGLRTPRLLLRTWRAADREPLAEMNADPQVMEHFPAVLSRAESDAFFQRLVNHFTEHGFGLWAVEWVGVSPLIGFVGLSVPGFHAPFTPCVEIGWRLARRWWGQGLAHEAAQAALHVGFQLLNLREIVSFTVPANLRSRRVMERLGMVHHPADDFDHPALPPGHRLRRHVLYRLRNPASCGPGWASPGQSATS